MRNPTNSTRDPRIERVLAAATEHGVNATPEHESGDLQGVLRAAWALMSAEQRDHLMAAAETLDVLQQGDDFVEVAGLRAYLMRDGGIHRVLIEVTRNGDGSAPYISSWKVFDQGRGEVDFQSCGIDTSGLKLLAGRLDEELLQAMPPQAVVPAWVSTIDWDLDRDELIHSVRIEGVDLNIQPSRWRNASESLDRHLLPECVDRWQEERRVVMALQPGLGRAMPGWAELTLNTAALDRLRARRDVNLGGPVLPVRAGGAAEGKGPSSYFNEPQLLMRDGAEQLQLAGSNEEHWPVNGGRVPVRLFLQWVDTRPSRETLFISEAGELLNDIEGFARHHAWVDEYHRTTSAAFEEPECEFDGERIRG
jgi:hypothetical protein